jgi:hypothetical protein
MKWVIIILLLPFALVGLRFAAFMLDLFLGGRWYD